MLPLQHPPSPPNGSRQRVEVLSQKGREELKNAVVQLVNHHSDNRLALAEVADLVTSSTEREKGVLKLCISVEDQTEVESLHTLEACVSSVLALARDSQRENLRKETREKIANLVFMIREVVDSQKFNRPRLLNLFCNEETLHVYLIWVLHKENVMSLNTYLSFKSSNLGFAEAFSKELFSNISINDKESWFLEIIALLVKISVCAQKDTDSFKLKKISKQILDLLCKIIFDDLSKNLNNMNILDLTNFCPLGILKQHYQSLLSLWLAHRPVLKVADALKQQKDWTFGKLSLSLINWYKQLLITMEPEEVLEQMKVVMETQEVNWQTVLSFLSTTVVCMQRFSDLIREYILSLLRDGLEISNVENLVIAFLFARQCCMEGPHVFASYPDWFQGIFSEVHLTPAGNRKTFTCLVKFLTDMVPFDSASHLKAHIVRPPFVPPKCRDLLTDYIMLAKTRLADLKQPVDGMPEEQDQESRKKVNEQIEEEIQKAIALFEDSRKIPSSVMEASIFRKPYYVGKFLPVLLKPRALPDIPDSRMKFIDALKQVEKIPSTLFSNYLTACKAESSRLLEGVFLEEEEDMDMELSEVEQLQLRLDQLVTAILNNPSSSVVEQCSLVREKLLTVLNIDSSRAAPLNTSTPSVVLNIDAADISEQKMKVVDQLLECLAHVSQKGVHMSDSLSWPKDLFTVLVDIREIHSALLIRIWKLIIEQGCELDFHHIRTLGFCLAYIDHLSSSEVTIQSCQGACPLLKGQFLHLIWQELLLCTSSWRKFALRLMVEYVDIVSCMRKVSSETEYLLPSIFCNRFQFLCGHFKDLSSEGEFCSDTCVQLLKEDIKSIIFKTKLPFREWIPLAMKITIPDPDGRLSFAEWQVHVHNTVFNSYLLEESLLSGFVNESRREMCGALFTDLVLAEYNLSQNSFPECEKCRSKFRQRKTEKQLYFITVLHTMVLNINLDNTGVSWLSQQIMTEMEKRESNLEKELCINAILRVISCLPPYLLFTDSPSLPVVLDQPVQIINHSFTCACPCGYFPARETIHLMQGLSQLTNRQDVEAILQECPSLLLSAMVHIQFTKNLIISICQTSTNPGLQDLMKLIDWVDSCKTKAVAMPLVLKVESYCVSGALISLLHVRSPSLTQIIRTEARTNESKNGRILEGFAVLLVSELICVKNIFQEEAEQALGDLLSWKPDILTSLADIRNWTALLPEHVLCMIPYTLLIFLVRRPNSKWQNSLSFLSSLLLLYKEVLQLMETTSKNIVQMNEWVELIKFFERCFKSASREQLQNLPKGLLSDCGADIILLYQQNNR